MTMIKHMGKLAVLSIALMALLGCVGELSYKRVDELPTGSQIDALASAFHAVIRTPQVRYLFTASQEDVWAAAKEVMPALKETGKEPVLTFEEEQGVLVLGLDHRDDIAKTMDNPNPIRIKGWREEIRVEFMRQPRDTTLVIVSRLVLGVPFQRRCHKYEEPCAKPIVFEPEVSNGEMERYVISLIRRAVDKQIVAKATNSVPPPTSPPEEAVSAPPLDLPPSPNLIAPAASRPQALPPIPIPAPDSEALAPAPAPSDTASPTTSPASTSGTTEGVSPAPPSDVPPATTSPAANGNTPVESTGTVAADPPTSPTSVSPTTHTSEGAASASPSETPAAPPSSVPSHTVPGGSAHTPQSEIPGTEQQ